jgi:DNA primase
VRVMNVIYGIINVWESLKIYNFSMTSGGRGWEILWIFHS